jgi:hypothetical protein
VPPSGRRERLPVSFRCKTSALPYLHAHGTTRFWTFSLSDADETGERGPLDVYERGTLLIWIDNLFERVLTPAQRTLGRHANYRRYFVAPDWARLRICAVQYAGGPGEPRRHGDFDAPAALERILAQVEGGSCP